MSIPGLTGIGGVSKMTPVTQLSLVGGNRSFDSSTVAMPAGIRGGDLAVSCDWGWGTPITYANAAGFTEIAAIASSYYHRVRYKILRGDETFVDGMVDVGGTWTGKTIVVFRPNGVITKVTVGPWNAQDAGGYKAGNQTISVSGLASPFVLIASSTRYRNPTFSTGADGSIDADELRCSYKICNSASGNVTAASDFGTSSKNTLMSGYIRVS